VVIYVISLVFHHVTQWSRARGGLIPGETPERSVKKALPTLSGRRVKVRMLPPEFSASLTAVPVFTEITKLLDAANAAVVDIRSNATARTLRVPSKDWQLPMKARMADSPSGWVQWDARATDFAMQAVFHLSQFVDSDKSVPANSPGV